MQQNLSEVFYLDASTPVFDQANQSENKKIEPHNQICLNFTLLNCAPQVPYQLQLSVAKDKGEKMQKIGYTSQHYVQGQNLSIIFNLNFIIDYYFEHIQEILIEVAKGPQFIGMKLELPSIIKAPNSTLTYGFSNSFEQVVVTAVELAKSNMKLTMDVEVMGNEKPLFYVIKKSKFSTYSNVNVAKDFVAVYKSEVSINGKFSPMLVFSNYLDYGDHRRSIRIEFYELGMFVGAKETTVAELLLGGANGFMFSMNNKSVVIKTKEEENKKKSFSQLIKTLNLNLHIGIDFTGSNGHYLDKGTLHYIPQEKDKKTLYESAIYECGKILENYDSDKCYPVFGFGAIPPNAKEVCHCFPLTLSNSSFINGLDNVLKVYRENMPKLTFSGPTNFAPILRTMFTAIKNTSVDKKNYNIILLLTDGMIDDMEDTLDVIVEACNLPVSLIIIGMGDAKFDEMHYLDCDNGYLESLKSGKKSNRDIVQFVEFNSVGNDPKKLAEKVLEEIPMQIEEYYERQLF